MTVGVNINSRSLRSLKILKTQLKTLKREYVKGYQLVQQGHKENFSGVIDAVIGLALTMFSGFILIFFAYRYAISARNHFKNGYTKVSAGKKKMQDVEPKIKLVISRIGSLKTKIMALYHAKVLSQQKPN